MTRLSLGKRKEIENLLKQNVPVPEISKLIGLCKSTIYRELRKCKGEYSAKKAHQNTCKGHHAIDYNIIGKKYGHLTIIKYLGQKVNHRTFWLAKCDCGNETKISRKILGEYCSPKRPLSCGCVAKQSAGQDREFPVEESALRKYQDLLKFRKIAGKCWIWTGGIIKGVCRTSWRSNSMSVRKCMHLIMTGKKYEPESVYAKCRNRFCFNPEHIALGYVGKNFYKD